MINTINSIRTGMHRHTVGSLCTTNYNHDIQIIVSIN